jgi:hypothetical protein
VKSATSPLAATTTITAGVDDTLQLSVGGIPQTVTLAAGAYSRTALADAITAASGGTLSASLDASNDLVLTTSHEGSAASIQITGGSALSALGLTTDATAIVGTDGIVDVDGTATTLTDLVAGASVVALGHRRHRERGPRRRRAGRIAHGNQREHRTRLGAVVANVNAANAESLRRGADLAGQLPTRAGVRLRRAPR